MRAINYNQVPAPVTILMTSEDSENMNFPYYMDDVDGDYEGDKALIPIGSILYFVNDDYKMIVIDYVEIDNVTYLLYTEIGNSNNALVGPDGVYDGNYPIDDSGNDDSGNDSSSGGTK